MASLRLLPSSPPSSPTPCLRISCASRAHLAPTSTASKLRQCAKLPAPFWSPGPPLISHGARHASMPSRSLPPCLAASPTNATAEPSGNSSLYVVTGGTGFLGEHLVQQLLDRGHRVRLLCRSPAGIPVEQGQMEVVLGSIEEEVRLDALFEGPEGAVTPSPVAGVFHLAGIVEHSQRQAAQIERTTVTGTLNVLRAAKRAGVNRVVYASTSGTVAVGESPDFIGTDESPYAEEVTRSWPYYHFKIEAEKLARKWAEEQGLELICMRPTLLLGPGDRRLSSCRTVADLLDGKIPFLPTGGLSFVDVRDTARAFIQAMESGTPGATYLLGAENMTLEEFFSLVSKASGVPGPTLRVPFALAWSLASLASSVLAAVGQSNPSLDPVVVEMSRCFWYLEARKAKEELGFQTRDPQDTVADTVCWLQTNPPRP